MSLLEKREMVERRMAMAKKVALKERKKIHARETQARHQSNSVLYKLFFLPTDVVFCPVLV